MGAVADGVGTKAGGTQAVGNTVLHTGCETNCRLIVRAMRQCTAHIGNGVSLVTVITLGVHRTVLSTDSVAIIDVCCEAMFMRIYRADTFYQASIIADTTDTNHIAGTLNR